MGSDVPLPVGPPEKPQNLPPPQGEDVMVLWQSIPGGPELGEALRGFSGVMGSQSPQPLARPAQGSPAEEFKGALTSLPGTSEL